MDVKNNPVVQLLLGVVIFLLGAAMGGMYVKIQYLEGKMGVNKGVQAPGVADAGAQVAPTAPTAPVAPTTVNVTVTKDDPVRGDTNAKLTIVEFADYQCPFCERFHKDVYKQILTDYVDTGKARFVYKNLAFWDKNQRRPRMLPCVPRSRTNSGSFMIICLITKTVKIRGPFQLII
jgi:protein-disulfide isomerase